jgi:ABC-type transport system substrate-binding protein
VFRLHSPVASFYAGIVGADACQARPKTCDLSNGIVTDEAARRVTVHLTAPDPDFLKKLALPYAYAVPDGSAPREAVRKPLPATGPYQIASYRPGHELKLVRNPRFHEWSTAAQPDGYPDAIVWKLGVRLDDALTAIQRGHADWVLNYGPLPPGRRRQIMTQYASQAHTQLVPLTYYYFMNTRAPPFNDVRVRRRPGAAGTWQHRELPGHLALRSRCARGAVHVRPVTQEQLLPCLEGALRPPCRSAHPVESSLPAAAGRKRRSRDCLRPVEVDPDWEA